MNIGSFEHRISYTLPWSSPRAHYVIVSAPQAVEPWWQRYDPVKLRAVYRQYRLHYVAELLGYVTAITLMAYVYGWHIVPTVCLFFSGYFQ